MRETRQRFPFEIDAMVVLPDHLHAVWTLPEGDCDFPVRWRLIKIGFSKSNPGGEPLTTTRRVRGERGIWQRRYWEHMIRDEWDYSRHIDYCWFNPVKHGLVANVEDRPFSSFHRDNRDNPRPSDLARFRASPRRIRRAPAISRATATRESRVNVRVVARNNAKPHCADKPSACFFRTSCGPGIGAMRYRLLHPTNLATANLKFDPMGKTPEFKSRERECRPGQQREPGAWAA